MAKHLAEHSEEKSPRVKHTRKKGKDLALKILFGICLAGFLICAVAVAVIQIGRKSARDTYSDLRQEVQLTAMSAGSAADAEGAGEAGTAAGEKLTWVRTMDFDALHAISEDIVGWIRAEGTSIDYPVLQGEDNEQYLYNMYNGVYNYSGCIFMDYRVEDPAASRNLVIYGHHMGDGSMFGSLSLYKNADFYEEYPTMNYYTAEGDYTVELISGTVEDANEPFLRFAFDDDADLESYVNSFRERSVFQSDVTLDPGDRIISLCTCSYETDNSRFMVIGRLVPVTK